MSRHELGFVHRFVPAEGRGALALLLLHGTGGDESDLLPIGRKLAPGAALLGVRGKVLERGMPRFFRRLGEGVFDEADLIARAHELADFVGEAAACYALDARRVVAVGYSNGANIAAAVLLLRPGVLAGAVLFRAMVPLVPERPAALAGTPVLVVAGRADPIVPASEASRLAALLRDAGARVTFHAEQAGHELTVRDLEVAARWLGALQAGEGDRAAPGLK